jgi:hypothetical protein
MINITRKPDDGTNPSTIQVKRSKFKKTEYPIIVVPANGKLDWYEGARTMCFVYSKNHGNFILKGYRGEVDKYLKKNYTHYFCYVSMWHHGRTRGHWNFWKPDVTIYEPSKSNRECKWKYRIIKYSKSYNSYHNDKEIEIRLKRLPKKWIPEFDGF